MDTPPRNRPIVNLIRIPRSALGRSPQADALQRQFRAERIKIGMCAQIKISARKRWGSRNAFPELRLVENLRLVSACLEHSNFTRDGREVQPASGRDW